jgi:hypothetical protein
MNFKNQTRVTHPSENGLSTSIYQSNMVEQDECGEAW